MKHRSLPTFQASAPAALADEQLRRNLRKATTTIREKRRRVVEELSDWESLREAGRAVKEAALGNLEVHLDRLEEAVAGAGGRVHRAADAREANRIVGDLLSDRGMGEVVKVKSITTDEVGLNEALAARGMEAVETDLAELIIQLADEKSSHFLVPAIHKNRMQIRDLFRKELGLPELGDDPADLAEAARLHLRRKFLAARAAVSGANFAVAETGTVGVVESEGNGRMCLTLPRVLVTLMGVEKVLPAFRDLEVLLQLLPRSATGERMNPYTTLWTGVTPGDGPEEFHLVLLDNGRRRLLADPVGRQALHCIRCSACLNICPVYERVGGHAYHSVYPGPIGSILTPQLMGPGVHDSLPFASTLCGACAEVCPVKIEIPRVLLHLRGEVVEGPGPGSAPARRRGSVALRALSRWARRLLSGEAWLMRGLGLAFRRPRLYRWGLRVGRRVQRRFLDEEGWVEGLPGYGSGWTRGRDLPGLPGRSFREWWEEERASVPGAETPGRAGRPPSASGAGESDLVEIPFKAGGGATGRPLAGAGGDRGRAPAAGGSVPGSYRLKGRLSPERRLLLFTERVSDYRATVVRCTGREFSRVIGERLRARGVRRLVIPEDVPDAWLDGVSSETTGPEASGPGTPLEVLRDGGEKGALSAGTLASAGAVLTGCALAVAETGTIVLDSGPGQGRRALSLLPDHHVCVVFAHQVVEIVPEAVEALAETVRNRQAPLTFVSGPSATSDIELERVEGVHGPRVLDVLLVVDRARSP